MLVCGQRDVICDGLNVSLDSSCFAANGVGGADEGPEYGHAWPCMSMICLRCKGNSKDM